MFEIYKSRKWTYLIPVIMFWGCVPILLYVFIKDLFTNGFSSTTIIGPICICMVVFVGFIFWSIYQTDPYANIKKLQRVDPNLVERMEADFDENKMVCHHIWRGDEFYFFEGSLNFLVVPIGEVQSFSIRKGYSRSIGPHYDCCVNSAYGKAEFAIAFIIKGADDVLKVANQIATESGICVDMKGIDESEDTK